MLYEMWLDDEPYTLMKNGIKTIELRLCDEKRNNILPDDTIVFTNRKTHKKLAVRVKSIYRAPSFKELFGKITEPESMGFLNHESEEEMADAMRKYYSEAEEREYGTVGIEIYSPQYEVEFPVECGELKYVITIAICGEKVVFCKHRERNTIELPGGHIEQGETALDAAKRELYEETGIKNIKKIIPIGNYYACKTQKKSNGAFGGVFVAFTDDIPDEMPDFEMESVKLIGMLPYKRDGRQFIPRLPLDVTYFEIYSVIMYAFQKIMINDELL